MFLYGHINPFSAIFSPKNVSLKCMTQSFNQGPYNTVAGLPSQRWRSHSSRVGWDMLPCSDVTMSQSTFDWLCRDFCYGSLTTGMS